MPLIRREHLPENGITDEKRGDCIRIGSRREERCQDSFQGSHQSKRGASREVPEDS